MVPLSALWIPIVLSAVIVFVASSIIHMVIPYHRGDYQRVPDEDNVRAALRAAGLKRGLYIFPYGTHQDMKSPAMVEKYQQGPVGMMTVFDNGVPVMPKFLGQWFVFCLIVSFFVAYLTGHTVAPGLTYLQVFRVAGTAGFPRLRAGTPERRHLEGPAVGRRPQGSVRWIDLRVADCGNVWLAVAAVSCSQDKRRRGEIEERFPRLPPWE